MGMYCICVYENFSITNVQKFERRLKKWCKEECMHGRSMLIFDKPSLRIDVKPIVEENEGITIYKVVLPNITFAYTCEFGIKCTMYKIWENKTKSEIYNVPQKWNNTELWLCN